MLMNSFFVINEKSAAMTNGKTSISSQITIDKTHPIFNGHFPNQPIVPGVCMIQMIKEILENHLSSKLFFSSAGNIKFLSFINPEINNTLNVEISYSSSTLPFDVEAQLFRGDIIFFKVKGRFSNSL
jgi:3-hydroxyacyl-[acyl-carrier-protein] dehydratase